MPAPLPLQPFPFPFPPPPFTIPQTDPRELFDWLREKERVDVGGRPGLGPPMVRILMVTDGKGNFSANGNYSFSPVIEILADAPHWWVHFQITTAHRRKVPETFQTAVSAAYPGRAATGIKRALAPLPLQTEFKFSTSASGPSLSLQNFDQVWLFGLDAGTTTQLAPAEITALTSFMDGGGGVLAMGDHSTLGASLCAALPRVRYMRKWELNGVAGTPPDAFGPDRIDTLREGPTTGFQFMDQSDDVPQPIFPKRYYSPVSSGPARRTWFPHPILCGLDGLIDVLPDHMHEGECVAPVVVPAEFPGGVGPEVIANGRVLAHGTDNRQTDQGDFGIDTASVERDFGILGAYDGHDARANVGRIVVDATWHHWIRINLVGFLANPATPHFRKIRNFYWNVAVWLAPARQQRAMLHAATYGLLWARQFEELDGSEPLPALGTVALDALGRIASQCTAIEWVLDKLHLIAGIKRMSPDIALANELSSVLQPLVIHMLGGMMQAALPLVRSTGEGKRKGPDVRAVDKALDAGAQKGLRSGLEAVQARHAFVGEWLSQVGKARAAQ